MKEVLSDRHVKCIEVIQQRINYEKDIQKIVDNTIVNTKGEGKKAGEYFWVNAEKPYYTALIRYTFHKTPEEEPEQYIELADGRL